MAHYLLCVTMSASSKILHLNNVQHIALQINANLMLQKHIRLIIALTTTSGDDLTTNKNQPTFIKSEFLYILISELTWHQQQKEKLHYKRRQG